MACEVRQTGLRGKKLGQKSVRIRPRCIGHQRHRSTALGVSDWGVIVVNPDLLVFVAKPHEPYFSRR